MCLPVHATEVYHAVHEQRMQDGTDQSHLAQNAPRHLHLAPKSGQSLFVTFQHTGTAKCDVTTMPCSPCSDVTTMPCSLCLFRARCWLWIAVTCCLDLHPVCQHKPSYKHAEHNSQALDSLAGVIVHHIRLFHVWPSLQVCRGWVGASGSIPVTSIGSACMCCCSECVIYWNLSMCMHSM